MKRNPIATRALAGMLPAMALFAIPAFAQDAAQAPPPASPPVVEVAPAAPPVAAQAEPAAPPVASGPSADDRAKFEASVAAATGSAEAAGETATPQSAARRAPARSVTRTVAPARVSAPVRAVPAAPVAAAPAQTAAPAATETAPVAAAPLPDAPMTTPVPDEAAPATATETQTETTTTQPGVPVWGWALGALALIVAAAAAVFAMRRRREQNVWADEPVAEEAVYAEPLAAIPADADLVAEEHAEVVAPAADEVAAITAGAAPVTGRPWIELSLRPLRAGTTDEAGFVDLELTLANAGELAARDVRVSTFMLGDGSDAPTDMDRLLANGHGGAEVNAGDLAAGEGSRVDASLAVPREGLDGATFQPIVVADVRYTLPNGSEGRTAAAFAVGVDDGTEDPTPLRLGGDIREDVAASLHGVPERA